MPATARRTPSTEPRRPGAARRAPPARWTLLALLALLAFVPLVLGGCQGRAEARRLSEKARALWEDGRYQDAARNFVTLSELFPGSPLAEPSLFWAASLYHQYLQDNDQAIRHYQHLIVTYPKGRYFIEGKENLASIFEQDKSTRYRALQIYQQLLLAPEVRDRRDYFQLKVGVLNMRMGKMDQARLAFRELLLKYPASAFRGETYYLVSYSYYLEKRYDLAKFAFQQTVKDFPGTPLSQRAAFFIADMLEERGEMREALKAFTAIKGSYPQPQIVEKRIRTLEARMRRGVR